MNMTLGQRMCIGLLGRLIVQLGPDQLFLFQRGSQVNYTNFLAAERGPGLHR